MSSLPVELQQDIVWCCDYRTLLVCALVHSSWTHYSRRALLSMHPVTLDSTNAITFINLVQHRYSTLRNELRAIRGLRLDLWSNRPDSKDTTAPVIDRERLLELIVAHGVRPSVMEFLSCQITAPWIESYPSLLALLRTVTELRLLTASLNVACLYPFLSDCLQLNRLEITLESLPYISGRDIPPGAALPASLRSLVLGSSSIPVLPANGAQRYIDSLSITLGTDSDIREAGELIGVAARLQVRHLEIKVESEPLPDDESWDLRHQLTLTDLLLEFCPCYMSWTFQLLHHSIEMIQRITLVLLACDWEPNHISELESYITRFRLMHISGRAVRFAVVADAELEARLRAFGEEFEGLHFTTLEGCGSIVHRDDAPSDPR